jgi:hypothetical protein
MLIQIRRLIRKWSSLVEGQFGLMLKAIARLGTLRQSEICLIMELNRLVVFVVVEFHSFLGRKYGGRLAATRRPRAKHPELTSMLQITLSRQVQKALNVCVFNCAAATSPREQTREKWRLRRFSDSLIEIYRFNYPKCLDYSVKYGRSFGKGLKLIMHISIY